MFPFGSMPPLVGLPGSLLLPLPQVLVLQQPYQLPTQAALPLVQLPLTPQLLLRPQVKPTVKTKVLPTTCAEKSKSTTKPATVLSNGTTSSKLKDSGTTAAEETKKSVASEAISKQPDERCENKGNFKREPKNRNLETNNCAETCNKLDKELKSAPEDQSSSVCSSSGNTKITKMKHVMVLDEDKNFCMELPLENDNTLSLKLLQSHFPGICGLTYRSSRCTHRQWIALDRGKLFAPKEGWDHNLYIGVFCRQSGGKWLHTYCHCSFTKPNKSKQIKSPSKSLSDKSNPPGNQASEMSGKNIKDDVVCESTKCNDPEICIVEEKKTASITTVTGALKHKPTNQEKEVKEPGCPGIVVFSLPHWVTEEILKIHFSKFGTVLTATIEKDLVGAHNGFIKFKDLNSQRKALSEVFHRFGDSWCSVHTRS